MSAVILSGLFAAARCCLPAHWHSIPPAAGTVQDTASAGDYIPAHGPSAVPPSRAPSAFRPEAGYPAVPDVRAENDRWVGHETGNSDPLYHLEHPWGHGHFPGDIGSGQAPALSRWRESARRDRDEALGGSGSHVRTRAK